MAEGGRGERGVERTSRTHRRGPAPSSGLPACGARLARAAMAVPALLLFGCGGDDPTGPDTGDEGWVQVVAGEAHACALDASGAVWCWGASEDGQAGTGAPVVAAPLRVDTELSFRAVAAGGRNSCAIADDDTLWCWGANDLGQVGNGRALDASSPTAVLGERRWSSVSVGTHHVCGVDTGGTLLCWGGDRWDVALGYLAPGTCSAPFATPSWPCAGAPMETDFGGSFGWVEAGLYQTCAGDAGRPARCWGTNSTGQLGTNTPEPCAGPDPLHPESRPCSRTPVAPDGPALERIHPGTTHACGLTSSGALHCWGGLSLHFGQVGHGLEEGAPAPVALEAGSTFTWAGTSDASQIHTFSCAVRDDGTALCWGANRFGQLGGETGERCGPNQAVCSPVPLPVSGGHAFRHLALGSEFACGLTTGGEVLCWGLNSRGQLGDGTTETRSEPRPVAF